MLLGGGLVAFAAAARAAAPSAVVAPPLEILFHADLGGQLAASPCPGVGRPAPDYAALVATLDAARAAAVARGAAPPLTLLGGNWSGPDPSGTAILQGPNGARTMAALLARGRYDAVALGHDELSLEPAMLDALLAAMATAGLPVVASNLRCDDARRPTCGAVKRALIVQAPNAVVGVLATISPSVIAGIPTDRMAGLSFEDPLAAIKAGVARLRAEGATRIVVLVDVPRDERALAEIDALQRRLEEGPRPELLLSTGLADQETGRAVRLLRREHAPPVVGSPVGARGLSVIELSGLGVEVAGASAASDQVDPETQRLLAPVEAGDCAAGRRPLAPAPVQGSLSRDDFVKYVLEVMRQRAGAEIALVNRDFVKRAPFPIAGTFTQGDLARALPYRAVIGAGRLTGPAVNSLLGSALANPKLAVIGLARKKGALLVNGRPLDKARSYRVATIAFVAAGGDGILAPHALPFRPLRGAPDLRDAVAAFLRGQTASQDDDPTVNVATDFGPPPVDRPLWVVLADGELDFSDTSISNGPGYGDAQLTRSQQTSVKGEATLVAQLRHPRHVLDGRFDAQYGWSRNQPPGMPAVSGENTDLITAIATYSYRGLHDWRRIPRRAIPDPYARVWLESEFTRPAVTPTQARTFHHLQLTNTAGAQLTLTPQLKVRAGAGAQSELLAPGAAGDWRAVIEAGATLDPTALATWGAVAVKLEGLVDYDLVDPFATRQHQLRVTSKLSVPLVPSLFLTVGLDVFAVQRQELGWGESYDTVIGLRVHTDAAFQRL